MHASDLGVILYEHGVSQSSSLGFTMSRTVLVLHAVIEDLEKTSVKWDKQFMIELSCLDSRIMHASLTTFYVDTLELQRPIRIELFVRSQRGTTSLLLLVLIPTYLGTLAIDHDGLGNGDWQQLSRAPQYGRIITRVN